MAWELDHIFILTATGGAAGDRLVAAGLTPGSGQTHPGQGTSNRCFFFHNAMLELLWVSDPAEAQSEVTQPTYLWERWQGRAGAASPFGFGLRPRAGTGRGAPHFPTWDYRPAYLPGPLPIYMGDNAAKLTEPLPFAIPFGQRPDARNEQPLEHPIGWRELTGVRLIGPGLDQPSPALAQASAIAGIDLVPSVHPGLELQFDGATTGQKLNCWPDLPLFCSW